MKHAKLSPSASHRWLVCPGSVKANESKPFEQSVYAMEGTSAHALLEVCLRLDDEPQNYIGMTLEKDHHEVTAEMAAAVGYALDYVRAYMADNPKARLLIEHTVYMDTEVGLPEPGDGQYDFCFGTGDVIIDNYPKEVVNLDYKHGVGNVISVKDNSQLRLYALGMRAERGRYQRYRNVVVQPRVKGRKPVQEVSLADKELTQWRDKVVIPVVPVALGPDAPRVAGDHCRYCHADGNCKAQYELVMEMAKKEFKSNDPKSLAPADIAAALDALERVNRLGKAIKDRAVALVHAGVDIPGYEADFTSPHRIWVDEDKATELLAKLGLEKRERYTVELLTPSKAEDALRKKGLWPKKAKGEQATNPLEFVVVKPKGNPSISRKAD